MVPLRLKKLGRRVRLPASGAASLSVRVPDGRSIALEEYGDPAGPVVLYFHGWPASRLEAGLIADLPVRLLALDRPGYGRSSPMPGRTLIDWARDVDYVTTRLGIERFHVVGLSGGGPYAAACAHAMPDRVLSLSLVSPVPPPETVPHRTPGIGLLFRLGRHPRLAHRLFAVARPLLRRRWITPRTVVGGGLPEADRAVLSHVVLSGLGRAWREGFRRGIQGALSDAQIYAHPWGFDLSEIAMPASLWFGARDSLIPEECLAPYAAIPGIRWNVLPDEGHYSLALRHAAAILTELTSAFPVSVARSVGALPDGITFYRPA
jgi:pimeloyl-ACP methyl ester carboxylesterase